MKGQVNVEFIVSFLVFLSILSFVSFKIISNYPEFRKETIKNFMISKAYQISHILIYDDGYPPDWNLSNVEMIGLTSGVPYILNYNKILELNCNETEYQKIKSIFGVERLDLIINITYNGTPLSTCSPTHISLVRPKYWIERFAVTNISGSFKVIKIDIAVY